jgi:histidinol-phosphate aminotransferase
VLNAQAARIRDDRAHLAAALRALPQLTLYPSDANFILTRVPNADDLYRRLEARKVLVRNLHGGHPLLENCLRFTVGTPEENQQLLAALRASL